MEKRHNQEAFKQRDAQFRGIKMKRKPMFDDSGTTLLNGVKLSFEKGFGFHQNSQLKNTAYCIDDNRIVYLLSSQIVIYDMLAQTQKVIDCFDSDQEVGAMMYFKNIMLEDNMVYALHNCNKSFPSLTLMNVSKNFPHKIPLANLQRQEKITDLALLNDFRNIATISRLDKLARLTIIQIATKDIKTSEYLNFNPIAVYSIPQFSTKIIFHTQNQIYINDIQDGFNIFTLGIRKILQFQNQNIVQITNSLHNQYCVYAITDQGNLYFIYIDMKQIKIIKTDRYFLGNYKTVDQKDLQINNRKKPSSLCANQYNLVIGYQLIQQFTLVKICAVSSQPPSFESIKFSCPFLHKIVRMNFAAQTMAICVIVQVKQNDKFDFCIPIQSQYLKQRGGNKIIKQNLSNHLLAPGKVFPIVFNLLLYDTLVQTLRSPVQAVLNSLLLTKKVLDICVLPTKKLILVLSGQKRIKAIKYQHVSSISFDRMLAWQMIFNSNDQPTSLDVHPLTFNVAVGLKDGVKLYNLFSDGMRTTNLFFMLKNCQCVRYSRYGHLLIAGSPNQIIFINPYQNIIKQTIQLSSGYNTKQLSFIDRDMYIFGYFMNGSSQILNLQGNKIFEVWNKTKCIYSCYDPVFDIMIISYDDNVVKFYRERGEIQFAIMWTYPFLITRILLVNQLGTAFMGTSTGKIRAYQWPFTDMVKFNKSYTQVQLHRTPVIQIKITHDFSFLITGSEDGTIFISKITPFSDGIAVSDSSILHTFKINKKNYTSLYYLQNLLCTNNNIQNQRQQDIMRYQSDLTDSNSQFIQILKQQQKNKQKQYQLLNYNNNKQFNKQIQPLQQQIDKINRNKLQIKQQLTIYDNNYITQCQKMQDKKLQQMKKLYKQSDYLKNKLQFYKKQYEQQIKQKQISYNSIYNNKNKQKQQQQQYMFNLCIEKQNDFLQNLNNYKEMMKLQDQLGLVYKNKMIEQLQNQLKYQKQYSQKLRKQQNKFNHSIKKQQQKSKYIQQFTTQIQIDLKSAIIKNQNLGKQIIELTEILKQKDKKIFNQEKAVKQLLKKSINNYSHEQYLKHKQDQLIEKAKYLEKEIEALDDKYKQFQENFISTSKQTNDYMANIEIAYKNIEGLKQKQKNIKQNSYLRRYKIKQLYSKTLQYFHQCNSKQIFAERIKNILKIDDQLFKNGYKQQKFQTNVQKRDHLIDKVVNTNKLRKIDDTIRKTIMIKLNRETVCLTSQVNQLRKQKKILSVKIRDLQACIKEIMQQFQDKENKDASLSDIVPVNISVIRSQNSKHVKPLPFQVYHQGKLLSQHSSTHSKVNSKSIMEQGSTQLPSIIKYSQSYAGSLPQQSMLFGFGQNQDQIAQ